LVKDCGETWILPGGGMALQRALSPASGKYFKILFKGFNIFIEFITPLYLVFAADNKRNIFAADVKLM
jgi:hypothetical protein